MMVEVCQAWSSIEVFAVSIIVSLFQVHELARTMNDSICDIHLPNSISCFEFEAKLLTGCWVLFAASIFHIFLGMFVVMACRKALQLRREFDTLPKAQYIHFGVLPKDFLREEPMSW